jgi:vanillate O-demethylase monooxygenase subunit
MEAGSGNLEDPDRVGFHMRGFHGVTPETETATHYFWSISSNRNPDRPGAIERIIGDTALTFDEDRAVIEAQFANMQRFPGAPLTDIGVDNAPNRARRMIAKLNTPS